MRGYLWERLHTEVEDTFIALSGHIELDAQESFSISGSIELRTYWFARQDFHEARASFEWLRANDPARRRDRGHVVAGCAAALSCPHPPQQGSLLCADHLVAARLRSEKYLQRRKHHVGCAGALSCRRPRVEGSRFCAAHLEAARLRDAAYRRRHAKPRVKKPRRTDAQKRARRKKERALRLWRRNKNLCIHCGAKCSPGRAQCSTHLRKDREKKRKINVG